MVVSISTPHPRVYLHFFPPSSCPLMLEKVQNIFLTPYILATVSILHEVQHLIIRTPVSLLKLLTRFSQKLVFGVDY